MKKQALEWKWNECPFKKLLNFLKSIENSVKRMNIDVRVKTFFLIPVKTKFDQQIPTKKKALCSGSLEFFFYPTICVRRGPNSCCSANEPTLSPLLSSAFKRAAVVETGTFWFARVTQQLIWGSRVEASYVGFIGNEI